jgi:hypothetical protein
LVIVMLFLVPCVSFAQDWWEDDFEDYPPITLELNAWVSEIEGTIQWGSTSVPGSEIDLREGAMLDTQSVTPYIRLNIGMSDQWDVRLSFWHTKHEGSVALAQAESFGGISFPSGVDTETRLAVDSYSVLMGYKFIDGEQLDFTALFGGGAYRVTMEMENTTGLLAEQDTLIPAPLLGLEMTVQLADTLALRAQAMGVAMSIDNASGQAVDAEAALAWTFYEGLYLTGGYKLFRADVEFQSDTSEVQNNADFEIKGPFFGLALIF